MVHLQRVMGKDHDAKVQMWKKNLEENESACLFLQEVIKKQFPPLSVISFPESSFPLTSGSGNERLWDNPFG